MTDLTLFFAIQSTMGRYRHALDSIYKKFNAKHCFIGKFIDDDSVKTVLHLANGEQAENFVYPLTGSPCAEAKSSQGTCCYSTNVQSFFPNDVALFDWNIDSYLAVTIRSFNDKPVGILVCLFDHPIDISSSDKAWFSEVGYLIGAEFNYELNQADYRHLIAQMSAGESLAKLCSIEWRPQSNQLFCSDYTYEMFGVEPSNSLTMDRLMAMVDKRDLDSVKRHVERLTDTEEASFQLEFSIHLSNGALKHLHVYGQSSHDELTDELIVHMSVQDVTAKQQLHNELLLSSTVFEHSTEAIMITDYDNKIILVNKALQELTGYSQAELLGEDPSIFGSGKQDSTFYENMWQSLHSNGVWRGEIFNKRKNGEIFPEELSLSVVKDKHGEISNYVAVFRDISEWKATEKRLTFYASKESLTGLANRRAFIECIDKHVQFGERFNVPFSVMFVDVNRFKETNDIYGHELGDKLLIAIGKRLLSIVKNEDFVCRYGGDEFTILLPEQQVSQAKIIAEKIAQSLSTTFNFDKISLNVSVTIGLAQYPDSASTSEDLLRSAAHALTNAKTSDGKRIGVHDTELQNGYLRKLALRDKLKTALEQKALTVYYQPIICARTMRIKKFEALVRWFDSLFGFISPGEFIPIAEEFGLISALGQFVLEQSCHDLKKLHLLGFTDVSVSINRSINEFRTDNDQVTLVKKAIADSGVPAENIMIEITESIAMSSNNYVKEALSAMKEYGIKVALDDFCTGFSSLSNLIDYPVDVLKIDKTFVDKILSHNKHSLLTQTLIDLAERLGLQVVAEGVEELAQLERLREYGCQLIQGYYFSPAVDIDQCIKLLEDDKSAVNAIA